LQIYIQLNSTMQYGHNFRNALQLIRAEQLELLVDSVLEVDFLTCWSLMLCLNDYNTAIFLCDDNVFDVVTQ